MTVMVALLRGVNVGGRNKLDMADLRGAAEACGWVDARTYIQSGNLVFVTPASSTRGIAERLRDAIADVTPVRPEVVVRTRDQLATTVASNPFLARGEDPAHLHVVFVNGDAEAMVGGIDLGACAPEEAAAAGSELYLFLPSGMGRSKLAADLARRKGPAGTARNWRTVIKLLEMADEVTGATA